MPLRLKYGPHASGDLHDIWSYIEAENPTAADKLMERFSVLFASLAQNPALGRSREELRRGLRSFPHGRYIIFYRQERNALQILRVLSSYRDITPEMLQD